MQINGISIKWMFLFNIIESLEVNLTKYENITIIPPT